MATAGHRSDVMIEEIVVRARAQAYYQMRESNFGTKTPTDFLDIPQSLQVLSLQLIRDQAARQITDLYRSISGVTQFSYSDVTFRGFRQDEIRYDGVAGDPFSEFSIPQLFNIERIEVLKGPSGMLYGAAQAGGLINYVSKKPQAKQHSRLSIFSGNYDLFGASGEYTGAVNDSETVRIRLGGFYQEKEPFRYNTAEENTIFDVGLKYVPTDSTSVLLQGTYVDQTFQSARLRGVPVDASGRFLTDIRWNHNEPTDSQDLNANVLQGRVQHAFNEALSATLTLRYLENEQNQDYHEPRGVFDSNGDGQADMMHRQYRDQRRENDEMSVTFDTVYQTEFAGLYHTILIGGEFFDQSSFEDLRSEFSQSAGGRVPPISLFSPVYGRTSGAVYQPIQNMDLYEYDRTFYGLYIQDQVELTDQLQLVGGLRYNAYKDKADFDTRFGDFNHDSKTDALTFRGGVIYKPIPSLSLYASYSQGFKPPLIFDQTFRDGGPFDPEESEQFEGGVKSELFDGRLQATAAIYQINKENVLQGHPTDPDLTIEFGEVRARGVEFDLVGDIIDYWTFMANYAYNDTEVTQTNDTFFVNTVGDRFANAPRHSLGLWTRYDLPGIHSAIAGGMDYVSERVNLSGDKIRPYTVFDLSWQTRWKNLNFQVNIRNLFDKEYAASGFSRDGGNFPGEPRTITFQVTVDM